VKIFLTGHTGFKGSWFSIMLSLQGHEVFGYSLDPLRGGIFESTQLGNRITSDLRGDIRDEVLLERALTTAQPDFVFHMAAQPLVRTSYLDPKETFETNVTGPLNVLQATKKLPNVRGIAVVSTDKVYLNLEQRKPFIETDPLGSGDPYSTSKAMADLLTQSWVSKVSDTPTVILRAGNVIGGGDVSDNRLIPDIVRSQRDNCAPTLRNPGAVRPWQHVLDCLNGYKLAMEWTLENSKSTILNFGPLNGEYRTVGEVAEKYIEISHGKSWMLQKLEELPESNFLALNSEKARTLLDWKEQFNFEDSLSATYKWYLEQEKKSDMYDFTVQQIQKHSTKRMTK
jgi:CDP-glucose 4,6-dehydratase